MGADSGGDDGISLDDDVAEAGDVEDNEDEVAGFGSRNNSRTGTSTVVDFDGVANGGIMTVTVEDLRIAPQCRLYQLLLLVSLSSS